MPHAAAISRTPPPSDYQPPHPARSLPTQAGAGSTPALQRLRYWPSDLLYAFTLQMAAHGQCVSASTMLGDQAYALAQLNHAHALGDAELRALAVRLFAYFDAPVRPAALLH